MLDNRDRSSTREKPDGLHHCLRAACSEASQNSALGGWCPEGTRSAPPGDRTANAAPALTFADLAGAGVAQATASAVASAASVAWREELAEQLHSHMLSVQETIRTGQQSAESSTSANFVCLRHEVQAEIHQLCHGLHESFEQQLNELLLQRESSCVAECSTEQLPHRQPESGRTSCIVVVDSDIATTAQAPAPRTSETAAIHACAPAVYTSSSPSIVPSEVRCEWWHGVKPSKANTKGTFSSSSSSARCAPVPTHTTHSSAGTGMAPIVTVFNEFASDMKEFNEMPGILKRCQAKLWVEPKREGCLANIVKSKTFFRLCLCVIIANTICAVVTTNNRAQAGSLVLRTGEQALLTSVMEWFFICFYVAEVLLKMFVHRMYFFTNQDWAWNVFDLVIVLWSGLEFTLESALDDTVIDLRFIRVCRVLRVSKILRIFRAFRFLFELRLMVSCVLGSVIPLMWAAVLLVLILMIFSLIFVECMIEVQIDDPNLDPLIVQEINENFGSVWKAMVVLFQSTTGGQDWGGPYDVVSSNAGRIYSFIFLAFITFFVFAFFNIVTSIFVDKAMNLAQNDLEYTRLQRTREEITKARELRAMIAVFDTDRSGTISRTELAGLAKDPQIKDCFDAYDLNIKDADQLFMTVSELVGVDELDIDTFVAGWLKMKGSATSFDQQAIILQMYRLTDMIDLIAKTLDCDVSRHAMYERRKHRGLINSMQL